MTEEQIDLHVAQRTDAADRAFVSRGISEAEYKDALRNIEAWAERKRRVMDKPA